MKNLLFLLTFSLMGFSGLAQNCDIKIEILPEQFMYGTISVIDDEVKKTQVEFRENVMEVFLSLNDTNYKFVVLNENCKAYCKRQKRVRQLNSGDERLVKNLLSDREKEILTQLKKCGV